MKFTDKIADYIFENELDVKHLTIILPSERAIRYISASLFNRNGKPMIAPEMLTIDRWIRKHSSKTIIDRTRLLVRLFNVQLENPADPKDLSFDEFQTWGQTLLSDFDEIDRYLLDSKLVFRNLADIREIENWSFNSTEPTPAQKRFMDFWDRLPHYYKRLNEVLDDEKVCYPGKAYRELAENIDRVFKADKERVFLFAGFNALSAAELAIMKQLHRLGRAHILIDADKFYLDDNVHEAGLFLRQMLADLELKTPKYVGDRLLNDPKEIHVIECAQQTGQVKSAATVLNDLPAEEMDDTLLLLADEALIGPLLRNIPANVGTANISLGLPIRNTALRTWMDLLFNIQENKQRFKTDAIYFQDLQRFWNHPFCTAIMDDRERTTITAMELEAIQKNRIFRNAESLKMGEKFDELFALVHSSWSNNWHMAMQQIRSINSTLVKQLLEEDTFNRALLIGFDQAIIDFENITEEGLPDMNLRSFRGLLQQHWMNKSIAYHGNPIHGLQIMGLLETRLLDFKNIIVIGLNEGKMPPTNPIQTMIPMDLRAWLKLPTPREKQGLFAHHFYRLLHQCENLWVTYSSAKEAIGSNEASRYLMQLELELSRRNSKIKWKNYLYSISESEVKEGQTIIIPKTPEIQKKIDELFAKSVSASALNKYMSCPLDFYYRYIMEFGEEDDFEEDLESRTLGSFIHNVLEKLFTPFCRHDKSGNLKQPQPQALTSFDIEKMKGRVNQLVDEQFMERFNKDRKSFETGKNLLSYNMAKSLTNRVLDKEIEFLRKQTEPVFIEFLELKIKTPIELTIHGSLKTMQLSGVIDRIDTIGGKYRIVDYKSGKVKEADAEIQITEGETDLLKAFSKSKHALQLAMYSYMFREKFDIPASEVGLLSLINVSKGLIALKDKNGKSLHQITDLFPEFLGLLMENIYEPDLPFTHTVQQFSYCTYCN